MKVNEIISEAIPGLSTLARPFVNMAGKALTKSAERVASKNAAKAEKELAYQANKQIIKDVVGSKLNASIKVAGYIGWGTAIYTTGKDITALNKQLASGEIDQETYDQYLRYHMGKLVTELVATKLLGGVINKGGQIFGTLPFMGKLGEFISSLSPAAKASFIVWINNPMAYPAGGKEAFANWYAGETFAPEVAKASQKWLGSLALNSWRQIEEWTGVDVPTGAAQFGGPKGAPASTAPSADVVPAMGSEPGAMEFDSATGRWLNRPGD